MNEFSKEKKYILFGAGEIGRKALDFFGGENVAFFCDNNRIGQYVEAKEIISVHQLKKIYKDYRVVITILKAKFMVEIVMQLYRLEIPFSLLEEIMGAFVEHDLQKYNFLNKKKNFVYDQNYAYPIALDRMENAGVLGSYFWQDLWAAQHIYNNKPVVHFDIGSRIDGFIAHLLSFGQKVSLLDIRPLSHNIPGVEFIQCDATNLENIEDNSVESLSALCSLEHFGLGRYGDPIDPDACFKCFEAIQKKMKKDGQIYISVPIGKEHLEYNAHRVFAAKTIVSSFDKMKMLEFSSAYNENMQYHNDIHEYDEFTEKGGNLFGLFVFKKI